MTDRATIALRAAAFREINYNLPARPPHGRALGPGLVEK